MDCPLITLLIDGELYGLYTYGGHPWVGSDEYGTAGPSEVWTGHASHYSANGFGAIRFQEPCTGSTPAEALAAVAARIISEVAPEKLVAPSYRRWIKPVTTVEGHVE